MYSAKRFVVLEGLCAFVGHPTRGIPAGCGFATLHTQAYCLEHVEQLTLNHPMVDSGLYIDDYNAAATGDTEVECASRLVEFAVDLEIVVEDDLDCGLADDKAGLVASSSSLLKRLTRAFGRLKGGDTSIKTLGCSFAAGKTRASFHKQAVWRQRLHKQEKRKGRLATLRKAHRTRAYRIFSQGVHPAACYGSEIYGFSGPELNTLRSTGAAAMASSTTGRSLSALLAIRGDPAAIPAVSPIVAWAKEVWRAANANLPSSKGRHMQLKDLRTYWKSVTVKPPKRWTAVRGLSVQ